MLPASRLPPQPLPAPPSLVGLAADLAARGVGAAPPPGRQALLVDVRHAAAATAGREELMACAAPRTAKAEAAPRHHCPASTVTPRGRGRDGAQRWARGARPVNPSTSGRRCVWRCRVQQAGRGQTTCCPSLSLHHLVACPPGWSGSADLSLKEQHTSLKRGRTRSLGWTNGQVLSTHVYREAARHPNHWKASWKAPNHARGLFLTRPLYEKTITLRCFDRILCQRAACLPAACLP